MRMTEVYLALGSNVGDSKSHIINAINLLGDQLKNITLAPIYKSKAVGYTDQPDFLNTAIRAETKLTTTELLNLTQDIEKQLGRIKRFRWGPREIDIDIIFYGDQIIKRDKLTIPHPEFRNRGFVLKPLCDLNPKLIDPITKDNVENIFNELDESSRTLWTI
jgi:2-amino-4-hydroxy-6-hydroxymethyldihydropteridine diphosphokinase